MAYNTNIYLFVFLPVALITYQIVPSKNRWKALLFFSYLYFYLVSGKLLLYLMGTTFVTYAVAISMTWLRQKEQAGSRATITTQDKSALVQSEKPDTKKTAKQLKEYAKRKLHRQEKGLLILGIVLILGVLVILKYYNFFAGNVNGILQMHGHSDVFTIKKIAVPIGISFYTLQAIAYMADVYWKKNEPQRNIGKLALFLSFFPQIMEGPITNYTKMKEELYRGESLKADNLLNGFLWISWGLFKKIVIADRLNVVVAAIFDHYTEYSGAMIIAAAVFYTVQLYMEFSGSIDIVIGSGMLFGIKLLENFRQPFASKSASEFWRRWHISLGVWFKAYVFYPVSVSGIVKRWMHFSKKHKFSKYGSKLGVSAIALFPVWLCNGLWHGAQWNYIFYGIYYFVILLAEIAIKPVKQKVYTWLHIKETDYWVQKLQIGKTWIIIFTGEMFFRAQGLKAGMTMFVSIFHGFHPEKLMDGSLLQLGVGMADMIAIGVGCLIVAIIGSLREKNMNVIEKIKTLHLPVRWGLYYAIILFILIFGAYGMGYQQVDLIYAGF